jgi:hypothetical protein
MLYTQLSKRAKAENCAKIKINNKLGLANSRR